ncbi:hypothetical protein [Streptomyces sp. NPDC048606]|uniref:hypothetical protein n=1 Tax=Streptomyces sp. NPDC048606 TaxID=3154726 RepID=UPI003426EBB7
MEAILQLTQESEQVRLGTLVVLRGLCERDPSLAGPTMEIVRKAMTYWRADGSQTPAACDAAQALLTDLEGAVPPTEPPS